MKYLVRLPIIGRAGTQKPGILTYSLIFLQAYLLLHKVLKHFSAELVSEKASSGQKYNIDIRGSVIERMQAIDLEQFGVGDI